MKIVDHLLLDTFRQLAHCELCGRRRPVEPHHLWSRGMGGAGRLDVPENLIALCRDCHDRVHLGLIRRLCLQLLVADREGRTREQVEARVLALRRQSN